MYLDANDLYGYAMSKFLPTGRFKWILHTVVVISMEN